MSKDYTVGIQILTEIIYKENVSFIQGTRINITYSFKTGIFKNEIIEFGTLWHGLDC